MLTRDSWLWGLGIVAAVLAYLAAAPPITEWGYHAWVQFVAMIVATLSGKLATSPLAGDQK